MADKKTVRYTGIQPQFFPRLHYFARVLQTDIFCLRDDVQFVKRHKYPNGKIGLSYQAHSPIKTANGIYELLVPIKHNGLQSIKQTETNYHDNQLKTNALTVKNNYTKSLNFERYYPEIKEILLHQYNSLSELNIATFFWGLLHLLGEEKVTLDKLTFPYVRNILSRQNTFRLKGIALGSETKAASDPTIFKNEKIVALIKELGANEDYCGGTAIAAYMNQKLFEENGIVVHPQEWECREYTQCFMKQQPFFPNLSIIDLLMNVPKDEALTVIGNSN